MNRFFSPLLFLALFWGTPVQAANPDVVEVTSARGIKAWLVQDSKLPLINMRFSFRGGVETDPEDKQGLAVLTSGLLTQGAGAYDDGAFQEKLAAQSISMDIGATRDAIAGEVKTLSRHEGKAFRLLALALTQPRFDDGVFARARGQQETAVTMQLAKPSWQARYALYGQLFGDHPYVYRSLGTKASLERLTREDALAFVKKHLAQDNLLIAVVGDITLEALRQRLDQTFGALPAKADVPAIAPVAFSQKPATILTRREGTQTTIAFAAPMMPRDDPDWYAAQVANYILGGGGFSARLMKAVRAKEGLTYGISTGLAAMDKASLLAGGFDVDNAKAAEALALMQTVWQDFYELGVSAGEVAEAKAYLKGSAPLSLTSTDAIAEALLAMQQENLGIDYLDRYASLVDAVTRDDVVRVIKRWFDPAQLRFSFVGAPEGVTPDTTQDPIKE
ncbi:MAG: pitrilysin family protein [Bdellovibrionales bacterium]|jgi:zinc protease